MASMDQHRPETGPSGSATGAPRVSDILATNFGKTPQERSLLIDIIERGTGRNNLETAADRLKLHLTPESPDLEECLSRLVKVLVKVEIGSLQSISIRMACGKLAKQLKQKLMSEAIESDLPESRARAEQHLSPLEALHNLTSLKNQALLRHDLETLVFHIEQLGKISLSSEKFDERAAKSASIQEMIEKLLMREHSKALTPGMLAEMRAIAASPDNDPVGTATRWREHFLQLPSIEKVGGICLSLLQKSDSENISVRQLDELDLTRVRIAAARTLKEFKHISQLVREQYSTVLGQLLPSLRQAPPDSLLAFVVEREPDKQAA